MRRPNLLVTILIVLAIIALIVFIIDRVNVSTKGLGHPATHVSQLR